jgi:amino acid permease
MALIPTVALIAVIGMLSAYGFSLIGRVCAYTQAHSYRDAWDRAVGPKTSWIPAAACFMVTSCAVVAYSMILSDTIPSLAQSFLGVTLTRTQALVGITLVALLPLCLMKSLKALAPFSLVGIMGMIYTSGAMAWRFFDGNYAEGGKFVESLSVPPQFGPPTSLMNVIANPSIFVLISMLSTAFMAHYNAPKFYWELENNTLERYQLVVSVSFFISMLMFMAVASFGFATFGMACTGLVLKNYSTQDPLMSLSRIAVLLSLLFSYPLAFVGVRDGILDLLQVQERPDSLLNSVTVGLLTLITCVAYFVSDLRKLLAFNGATWGNAVIYLLPTYMFVQCSKNVKPELKSEVPLVITTGLLGLAMGIVGTVQAIGS